MSSKTKETTSWSNYPIGTKNEIRFFTLDAVLGGQRIKNPPVFNRFSHDISRLK